MKVLISFLYNDLCDEVIVDDDAVVAEVDVCDCASSSICSSVRLMISVISQEFRSARLYSSLLQGTNSILVMVLNVRCKVVRRCCTIFCVNSEVIYHDAAALPSTVLKWNSCITGASFVEVVVDIGLYVVCRE